MIQLITDNLSFEWHPFAAPCSRVDSFIQIMRIQPRVCALSPFLYAQTEVNSLWLTFHLTDKSRNIYFSPQKHLCPSQPAEERQWRKTNLQIEDKHEFNDKRKSFLDSVRQLLFVIIWKVIKKSYIYLNKFKKTHKNETAWKGEPLLIILTDLLALMLSLFYVSLSLLLLPRS